MTTTPLTDEELAVLRERYTPEPVPPCRVCGGRLTIGSMGGGNATKWGCATPDAPPLPDYRFKDEIKDRWFHYRYSSWTQYRDCDSLVIRLVAMVEAARSAALKL